MNFWPEFIKLKTAVGGNREALHYEESFGMPLEEQHHITPTNKDNKRILSQLEFAIRLNEEQNGAFDDSVCAALHCLTEAMAADGVLTRSVCRHAEELLLPCRDEQNLLNHGSHSMSLRRYRNDIHLADKPTGLFRHLPHTPCEVHLPQ